MCFYFFDEFVFVEYAPSNETRCSSNVVAQAVEELDKILALNDILITLKNHPDAGHFSPGVGPVSILGMNPNCLLGCYGVLTCQNHKLSLFCINALGGEYDDDKKMDDLKLLYRAYVTDSLSNGRMEENKVLFFFFLNEFVGKAFSKKIYLIGYFIFLF